MNQKNLLIAGAITLLLAVGIIAYKAKSKKGDTDDELKVAQNPFEGKSIYNPSIIETEGKIWTLIDGKWYSPSGGSNGWNNLPAKKEQNILPQSSYTQADFIKFPKGGEIDYSTLAQFK